MTDNFEQVTGGCECGAVRYEAEVNLGAAYYCHCKTCKKASGAPAEVGVFVKPETLKFPKEEPKYYQSGPFALRGFCAHCGSRIIWMSPDKPEWNNVCVGSLDHPEDATPVEHICVESQLPWFDVADDLPRTRSDDDPELVAVWEKYGLTHEGEPL